MFLQCNRKRKKEEGKKRAACRHAEGLRRRPPAKSFFLENKKQQKKRERGTNAEPAGVCCSSLPFWRLFLSSSSSSLRLSIPTLSRVQLGAPTLLQRGGPSLESSQISSSSFPLVNRWWLKYSQVYGSFFLSSSFHSSSSSFFLSLSKKKKMVENKNKIPKKNRLLCFVSEPKVDWNSFSRRRREATQATAMGPPD